jgi:uncharacterized protein YceK
MNNLANGSNQYPTKHHEFSPSDGNPIVLTGCSTVTNNTGSITSSGTYVTTVTTDQRQYSFGSAGTTAGYDMYHPKTLVDASVTEETIELKYIQRAKYSYTQSNFTIAGNHYNYTPDLAIKEIYGVMDGKLTLLKTVTGRVIPPQEIAETLEFPDEIDN